MECHVHRVPNNIRKVLRKQPQKRLTMCCDGEWRMVSSGSELLVPDIM